MCRKQICSICRKISWVGCGNHVDLILKDVPIQNRCKCPKH